MILKLQFPLGEFSFGELSSLFLQAVVLEYSKLFQQIGHQIGWTNSWRSE